MLWVVLLASSLGLAAVGVIDLTTGLPPRWRGGLGLVLVAVEFSAFVLLIRRDAGPSDQ